MICCLDRWVHYNGHVLQFKTTIEKLNSFECDSNFYPSKIGYNDATTFNGFCSKHDKELFSPVEDFNIVPTMEQITLLTYRSFAKEIYSKAAGISAHNLNESAIQEITGQTRLENKDIYSFSDTINSGFKSGVKNLEKEFFPLTEKILNKDFTDIDFLLIKLSNPPYLMGTTTVFPEITANHNQIQILVNEKEPEWISLSMFADSTFGYILFSWNSKHKKILNFIIDLLDQEDVVNNIIHFAVLYSDNFVFSPIWWENMKVICKRRLGILATSSYFLDLRTGEDLRFRKIRKWADWEMLEIISNNTTLESTFRTVNLFNDNN